VRTHRASVHIISQWKKCAERHCHNFLSAGVDDHDLSLRKGELATWLDDITSGE
jgi:hypothetical protein